MSAATVAERLFDRLATARRLTVAVAETLIQRRRELSNAAARLAAAEPDRARQRGQAERDPATYANAARRTIIEHRQ